MSLFILDMLLENAYASFLEIAILKNLRYLKDCLLNENQIFNFPKVVINDVSIL